MLLRRPLINLPNVKNLFWGDRLNAAHKKVCLLNCDLSKVHFALNLHIETENKRGIHLPQSDEGVIYSNILQFYLSLSLCAFNRGVITTENVCSMVRCRCYTININPLHPNRQQHFVFKCWWAKMYCWPNGSRAFCVTGIGVFVRSIESTKATLTNGKVSSTQSTKSISV